MVRSKGFTLIELLVVIAIIGLLASIILASLSTAQQKGRDARRISDMKEIQLALEVYYDANNNSYPVLPGSQQITSVAVSGSRPTVISSTNPSGLVPSYITQTPTDPSQPASGTSYYFYQYESLNSDNSQCSTGSCQAYVLFAHLEAGPNSSTWDGTGSGNGSLSSACLAGGGSSSPYDYCIHS